MHYAFADFVLDADGAELLRAGEPVRIEPQVFDLLKLLIEARGKMVSRDEIFERIWGNRIVSDATLSSRLKDARKALGDDGVSQRFIRTIQRRGLRFVPEVEALNDVAPAIPVTADAATTSPSDDRNGRIAVAVLPFEDLSDTASGKAFARGLTEELTVFLSYWGTFRVTARQSVARLPEDVGSATDIGHVLGADYLLDASLRSVGNRLKLRVSLTFAPDNTEIWSERLTFALDEFVDVEEEIASQISTMISAEVLMSEARRCQRKPQEAWTPWDKVVRSLHHLRSDAHRDYHAAEDLAQAAGRAAPDWGVPSSLVALVRFQKAMSGFSSADSSSAFAPTLKAANEALMIDRGSWLAHAFTAVGELWTHRNHTLALTHVDKALQLNPSAAMNHHFGGCIYGFSGQTERAIAIQERLFRVDPTYPYRAVIEADLGLWHMLQQDFDRSEEQLDKALLWDPNYGRALQRRVALYGLTGNRPRAQEALAALQSKGLPIDPDTIIQSYPFLQNTHRDLFFKGLRAAGVNL